MSSLLPKDAVIEIRGPKGSHPIAVTLDENLHFTPIHSETPEQEANQLAVAGLAALVDGVEEQESKKKK